jgi:hypothetical protein
MKFRYETGVVTFAQFIVMSLLGIPNALNSIITTCRHAGHDCVSNVIVSLIYFILLTAWFACLWLLGYAAQDRRSKRLAQLLICAEGLVLLVSLFDVKHHNDFLGLITSLIDLIFAAWVILLAFRLMRSGGGRIVAKQRPRQRRRPTARQ